jgi:hypothetical protein
VEELQMYNALMSQTQQELTDQIMKERKRTQLLLASATFWRTTDESSANIELGNMNLQPVASDLEFGFLSVLREGRLHLMFRKVTSGALFESAGGGVNGRDRLYVAVLPRRFDQGRKNETRGEEAHHCVLSEDTVVQLESAQPLTNVIVANVVELKRMVVNENIHVISAVAGEIFYPKLA